MSIQAVAGPAQAIGGAGMVRMVLQYFAGMRSAFRAISVHLVKNAVVAIDIGDSSDRGIRVPTDRLLVRVLESEGYRFEREIALRERASRDGTKLRQVLLVFRFDPSGAPGLQRAGAGKAAGHERTWRGAWQRFTKELPHQQGEYRKRNWGHPLHSLCSYQGKM